MNVVMLENASPLSATLVEPSRIQTTSKKDGGLKHVGAFDGEDVGKVVGWGDGEEVGKTVGWSDGDVVGAALGDVVGLEEGKSVGSGVGLGMAKV